LIPEIISPLLDKIYKNQSRYPNGISSTDFFTDFIQELDEEIVARYIELNQIINGMDSGIMEENNIHNCAKALGLSILPNGKIQLDQLSSELSNHR
jgi:hypothetical protein